jgi:hypothetical protein
MKIARFPGEASVKKIFIVCKVILQLGESFFFEKKLIFLHGNKFILNIKVKEMESEDMVLRPSR